MIREEYGGLAVRRIQAMLVLMALLIWVGGFSPSDREGGSGSQYGQSPWEAPVTYEGAVGQQTNATLPSSLPQAEFSSPFETSIYGYAGFPAARLN